VYFVWAVPQDGITAPVDFNASTSGYIKNIWNDAVNQDTSTTNGATITGPVGGYYTITLTQARVPAGAKMFTGGVGYSYGLSTTQPLTQTNLAAYPYTPGVPGVVGREGGEGGLSVPAPNVWKVGSVAGTASTARRTIVDNAKCNTCHVKLGAKPTYHAGQRNDAPTCTFCHTVNRVNSGWAVNSKEIIHGIHANAKRVNKFSWEATAGAKFWDVTYPGRGMLRNCEMCHAAGMYDFSNSAYTANNGALLNNMLFSTAATGTISATAVVIVDGTETGASIVSPFVTLGAGYGSGFSYNAGTGATTAAAATTLVISPISSACFACHDTAAARGHMVQNGGSIYEARSTALGNAETCIICHGPSANTAYGDFVPAIKAVHRWW
jgi:OmcA/MtrC family decaheme c-type cytochrome